ncbi:solute carrier family 22 member 20-like [Acanthaster planci]|uniref:Solute carrier family 22 member 20-like n=1 Tax=Acanthaster planci TaxID=133434 RepID=A0A8B8A4K7_ACAPL|nr:solute carrier family 22 member 20-like [Acanthaster planci]
MKFDEVLEILGGFGRYQWYAFFFLNLVNYLGAFTTLQHAFYAGESDHWCKTFSPNCTAFGLNTPEECTEAVKRVSIPPAENYPEKDPYYYDNCRQWGLPEGLKFNPYINHTDYNASKVACKNGWEFNTSQYETTIIMDWNLVCEDGGATNIMTSVYFGGFMAGSFIFGVISDWWGRKKALALAMVLWFLGALATPFTSATWQYYIVRFLTGTGQLGRWIPAYVLVNEFVSAKWRIVAGIFIGTTYSLGYMTVALVAMAIRKWRVLAFIPIIPLFLSLFFVIGLSESVRWLLSKGRVQEAEEVIRKVGKWNKKTLPEKIFDEKEIESYKQSSKGHVPSFIDLYRTPNLCFRTIILQFNWMTNSMVYYGLAFSAQSLGFDQYWTFFLFGAVEIPALIYATVGVRFFGCKINMVILELIGGAACLATIFIEDAIARTVVAMVGKFCITATFYIVYLWTGELCPTPVRSVALGLCSMTARVGSIVAPLILNLAKDENITDDLHLIVFGAAAVIAGILLAPLPETKGRKLPETMRDGEELGKFNFMKKWTWGRNRYRDTDSSVEEVDMDVYRQDVLNPAFVPDADDYAYTARPPPPYEAVNEKGCQISKKPRQKKKKAKEENGPVPGPGMQGNAAVEGSSPDTPGKVEDLVEGQRGINKGSLPEVETAPVVGDRPCAEEGDRGDGTDRGGGDRASKSRGDNAEEDVDDKARESGGHVAESNKYDDRVSSDGENTSSGADEASDEMNQTGGSKDYLESDEKVNDSGDSGSGYGGEWGDDGGGDKASDEGNQAGDKENNVSGKSGSIHDAGDGNDDRGSENLSDGNDKVGSGDIDSGEKDDGGGGKASGSGGDSSDTGRGSGKDE